jgi:hypothetical protein
MKKPYNDTDDYKYFCDHDNCHNYRVEAIRENNVDEIVLGQNNIPQVTLYLEICDNCGSMVCWDVVKKQLPRVYE